MGGKLGKHGSRGQREEWLKEGMVKSVTSAESPEEEEEGKCLLD